MIMAISGRHCCSWGKKPKVMKRILAGMIDQHAPAESRHCSLVEIQWLSINAQLTNGGRVFHSKKTAASVSRELNQPLKRLCFIQPRAPIWVTGGFNVSAICFLTISPMNRFPALTPILAPGVIFPPVSSSCCTSS